MKKSKIAATISTGYLLLVVLSFIIMLVTQKSTPMAGIFLVIVTYPWPVIIGTLGDGAQGNPALFIGLLLLAGGIMNVFLLYLFIRLIVGLVNRNIRR